MASKGSEATWGQNYARVSRLVTAAAVFLLSNSLSAAGKPHHCFTLSVNTGLRLTCGSVLARSRFSLGLFVAHVL